MKRTGIPFAWLTGSPKKVGTGHQEMISSSGGEGSKFSLINHP
jgi:hypothetical protein